MGISQARWIMAFLFFRDNLSEHWKKPNKPRTLYMEYVGYKIEEGDFLRWVWYGNYWHDLIEGIVHTELKIKYPYNNPPYLNLYNHCWTK